MNMVSRFVALGLVLGGGIGILNGSLLGDIPRGIVFGAGIGLILGLGIGEMLQRRAGF